ncbi:hypothetical protein HP439_11160 [Sphingobacterium shayense]|uniref:nuclear transport factor 2 family protein n=1 Tax=Sphingobacterium shayense TaxID=626343 RepID=UPI0015575C26|nr:nuclear transport factor 2 family protein [Sphingobacterium shayense]NQD71280.1 hypothetical protein [Sphingobacterium shayense]
MKKSIATIAAAIIMITSFSAFAIDKPNPAKNFTSSKIIASYVEVTTVGTVDLNNFLFADDFKYQNVANGHTFNKKEYAKFLDKNKGLQYNCETSYQILDENGKACFAKTTMKFKNFTRVDYLTLNHTGDGWKISEVVTSYGE